MKNMRVKTDGDDANGCRFRGEVREQTVKDIRLRLGLRGKVKERAVKEIQLGFRKLSLGKVPRSPKYPNALKPLKDVQFRSGENTLSSQKEAIALKPVKDVNFRFGDKPPLVRGMKHEAPIDILTWWDDMENYMAGDTEDVVVASVDKRDMDEAIERKEELDELFFQSSEALRREAHGYATAAISYMRKKGHNLELVKPCLFSSRFITMGIRTHFNFKAKRADDPSAPVETYFGQLRVCAANAMVVECCVSLGASDSLPYKRDNRGCQYCYDDVHHPEGGCEGIIWSREKNEYVVT